MTKKCASEVDWITELTSLLLENSVCQALVPLFTKFNLCLLIWNMKYPPLSFLAWAQPSRRQYRQTGVFHLNIGIRIYFQFHWLLLCYNEKVFDPGSVSYSTSKMSDTSLASQNERKRTLFIVILTHPNNCINVVLISEKFRHKKHI